MLSVVLFVVGLVLMVAGAEFLVRGASRLAVMIGVSPLVVGLTVVAFGTSAPEFAVSFKAALIDQSDLTLGNVIGSNIFNILFILGISALVAPLVVNSQLIRFDVPLVVIVSLIVLLMGSDGKYGRVDGLILFTGLIVYTGGLIFASRRQGEAALDSEVVELLHADESRSPLMRWLSNLLLVFAGLGMLGLGSNWLVESSITFARLMNVSEVVIGLTVIAIGTSLPEVVTSVVATLKNQRDIAVGNVVGSNLFNLLGVLGLSSIVAPEGIRVGTQVLWFDLPVMVAVAVAALPIFFTGGTISRWEGGLLLAYYFAYTTYLIMQATDHGSSESFRDAMIYFAIPLTALTLAVLMIHDIRRRVHNGKLTEGSGDAAPDDGD
ncbi:MAG: sodium:calcium antiporter [Planctomycetaceae bacterium]|nr:MAG: sodium:calcium antiporter [Planctomycetaceae bacterium]